MWKIETEYIRLHTAIVGSGAAGFSAALQLKKNGISDIAILTEAVQTGTSRNTGSDKQTYYKLSMSADAPDCPAAMAQDLFAGQSMDGDHAYAEAACSAPCFLRLAELGVPFPTNEWGEYVGYQTDHDTRARATSAGPLTSKLMTECLEDAVQKAGIAVYDGYLVVQILHNEKQAVGLLALRKTGVKRASFAVFQCENILWATGGPAGIYADTVYPVGQHGSSGIAFEAGALGKNLTEWQYGLASVQPKWNVSGTYMQVLPRVVSIDASGTEREFLLEHDPDIGRCLSRLFQKGYEWPFDSRKAFDGSSVIDLLVYRESVLKGRRVYLDYRSNPAHAKKLDYTLLREEARTYLERADACFGTPIDRLLHMNEPAYELYLSKGVDLKTQMLEIRLCAQHCNGGLDVDAWWQTSLAHLFAIGEAAGTHGVYRPGGSALNAGQVGAQRAAQYIAFHTPKTPPITDAEFQVIAQAALAQQKKWCAALSSDASNVSTLYAEVRQNMTHSAGAFRRMEDMKYTHTEIRTLLAHFSEKVHAADLDALLLAYQLRDTLLAQSMYLTAMEDYAQSSRCSRGSAIYPQDSGVCAAGLDECFRFCPDRGENAARVQLTDWNHGDCLCRWRSVRPLPSGGGVFETVWREFRQRQSTKPTSPHTRPT